MGKPRNYIAWKILIALSVGLLVAGGNQTVQAVRQVMDQPGQVQLTLPPTELSVQGCAAPNSLITVFRNNIPIGSEMSDAYGHFAKTMTISELGLHNIQLYYEDPETIRSDLSSYNISITAFENTNLAVQLLPTVHLADSRLAPGDQLVFTGFACPGSLFELVIDNSLWLPVAAQDDGRWYLTISSSGYYIGQHTYYLRYPLGQSDPLISQKKVFTISSDQTTPRSPAVSQLVPPQILFPGDNYLSSSPNITIVGSAQPNTQLEIWLNGNLSGALFVNPLGEWSFTFIMQSSQYSVRARACDAARCSDFSKEVTLYYYGGFSSCSLDFSLRQYRFFRLGTNRGLDLNIDIKSGAYPYHILLDWGDETVENITLATTRSIRYHHVFHNIGLYNGILTIRDSSGCQQTQYFSIEVVRIDSDRWWVVPGAIALSGGWLASRHLWSARQRKSPNKPSLPPDVETVA